VREAAIERIRKRIERLTEPARIEKARAKFGIGKPGAQLGSFLGEPNQPDEFTSLELANYLVKYVEENLINNWNVSDSQKESD
jgi:hypothetical protein